MSRLGAVSTGLALAVVLAAGGVAMALGPWAADDATAPFTLRLGMGPRDVRTRLARELPGALVAVPAAELALEWRGTSPDVRSLRLELHDGRLVAVRARLAASSPLARGDRLWQSSAAVLSRAPRGDSDVDYLLVARDCPTHRDEVARLLGRAAPSATAP